MAEQMSATAIKKLLKERQIILGTEKTLKEMKLGNVEQVLLTSNCPESVIEDVNHYAKLGDVETHTLSMPNDELGVICKKPFRISVLSVLKSAQ